MRGSSVDIRLIANRLSGLRDADLDFMGPPVSRLCDMPESETRDVGLLDAANMTISSSFLHTRRISCLASLVLALPKTGSSQFASHVPHEPN
jgi:hypothetical protein